VGPFGFPLDPRAARPPDSSFQPRRRGLSFAHAGKELRRRVGVFGPGLVHMLGAIGITDLIANSVIGATYGYKLLWALVVAYILNYCVAEAFSRYVLATGESIMEGYGRLGKPVVILLSAAIMIKRHITNLAYTLLLGHTLHLLIPLPTLWSPVIWSLLSVFTALALMVRGGYPGLELVCRGFLVLLGVSMVLVVIISGPAVSPLLEGLLVPSFPSGEGFYSHILLLMAITNTSVGSVNHLKYPTFVYEKGWRSARDLKKQRIDVALSITGQFLTAALIQIAAAAALQGQDVVIRNLQDLTAMFWIPLGDTGRVLLLLGVWGAVYPGYMGSNTGYSLIVADTYERFLRRRCEHSAETRDMIRRRASRVLLFVFCLSPLYGLFTSWEPIWLVLVGSALFVVLTPFVMAGLLVLTTNRSLMKDLTSPLASRIGIICAMLITLFLTYQSAVRLVADVAGK
jgi:manganese transport protein